MNTNRPDWYEWGQQGLIKKVTIHWRDPALVWVDTEITHTILLKSDSEREEYAHGVINLLIEVL